MIKNRFYLYTSLIINRYLCVEKKITISFCFFLLSILQKADLAVAPMTITYTRESVIDFSKPYMSLGNYYTFKFIFL